MTSLHGAAACAIVADLSLSKELPHPRDRLGAQGVTLDVLAVLHLVLTLIVGLSLAVVDGNFKHARQLARAQGHRELEDSLPYVWGLHWKSLRSWLLKDMSAMDDPVRLRGLLAAATVIQTRSLALAEVRRLLMITTPLQSTGNMEGQKTVLRLLKIPLPASLGSSVGAAAPAYSPVTGVGPVAHKQLAAAAAAAGTGASTLERHRE